MRAGSNRASEAVLSNVSTASRFAADPAFGVRPLGECHSRFTSRPSRVTTADSVKTDSSVADAADRNS